MRLCEHLASRVVASFQEASLATEGFLQFDQRRDANGMAMLHGLSIQRNAYTKTCLFFRIDPVHCATPWQLHEGGNLESALRGWWNIPVLQVDDQDEFVQSKILDLIRCPRETPTATAPASEHGPRWQHYFPRS